MKLQLLPYQEKEIRIILIKGQPHFVLKDVCDILDIQNAPQAASQLDDDEKLTYVLDISGQKRKTLLINESGLFSLMIRSNKAEARAFKKWITSVVLPEIRRTGKYTGKDVGWIEVRGDGKGTRIGFTGTLQSHDVQGSGYGSCTNGIYKGLYGKTAKQIKEEKGLSKSASLRDNMSAQELFDLDFSERLATIRIQAENARGNVPCEMICIKSSLYVRESIDKQLGR